MAKVEIGLFDLKALGTPKLGRDAAKTGDRAGLDALYSGQFVLQEPQAASARVRVPAAELPSALVCFGRDPDVGLRLARHG
jgi:hypothetical protein